MGGCLLLIEVIEWWWRAAQGIVPATLRAPFDDLTFI